ncbi:ankyrin-1-like [Mytilus trossulus]|uniref:ankyrin-1-like n=1 Tax=Mytilus trossulus TaxID=6551 RepID=UPI0030071D1D
MASLSVEEENYVRMSLLLTGISPRAVRICFDHDLAPDHLEDLLKKEYNKLLELSKEYLINQSQWNLLFPRFPDVPDSKTFDVTLMTTLLRNLTPMTCGFDCLPTTMETTKAADLARINHYRSYLAHLDDGKVDNTFFNMAWNDVTSAIERFGGEQMKQECDDMKTKPLDSTKQEIMMDIKHSNNEIRELKESFESLKLSHTEIIKSRELLQENHAVVTKEIEKIKTSQNDPIPKNIRDQMKNKIEDWEEKDKMFVSTRASDYVIQCLQNNSCLTLTGPSGVGKSFIARHTALVLQKEGYEIIPVRKPYDIRDYYQRKKRTVFIVDDICGNFTANQLQIDTWEKLLPWIYTIMTDKYCKIIVSCRLQVYRDKKFNVLAPFKSCECNLISDKLCLTSVEKNSIAKAFIGTGADDIDELSHKSEFFPLLCSLYDKGENGDINEFFKNPFEVYKKELDNLSRHGDEGNYKICGLALCVLFNNHLNEKWFQCKVIDEQSFRLLEDTCDACEIDRSTSKIKLMKALDTLDGTFIHKHNGIYSTVHDKLFDFLAHYFGQKMIECLIDHGDCNLVHERFTWQTSQDVKKSQIDFIIEIPDDYLNSYLERFVNDWSAGNVTFVFFNNIMKIPSFRQELLQYLKQLDRSKQETLANSKDTVLPKKACGSGNTPLGMFCYYGYTDMVRWKLQYDVDVLYTRVDGDERTPNVDLCNDSGISPLLAASQNGHTEIVKLLLKKNVNVDLCHQNGISPLYEACYVGHTDIVKLLLEHNPKVDLCDDVGCSSLVLASQAGYTEIVRLLLEKNANIDLCTNEGYGPLLVASLNGHTDTVKLLLEKNPNVNQCQKDGVSSLYEACSKGHTDMVRYLLENNSDVDLCSKDRISPLLLASQNGHTDIVRLLLARNSKVNICSINGISPLSRASHNGHTDIVKLLLEKNSNVDSCGNEGFSPLFLASENGHTEIVRLLLEKNPNTDICSSEGCSPLLMASQQGYTEIVRLLLEKNPNVDLCDKESRSPLLLASQKGHFEIARLLLEKSPNVDLSNKDCCSPLYMASHKGHTDIVRLLLEKNPNVDLCDKDSRSPLYMASQNGHTDIVRLLLEKISSVDLCDKDGCSPLFIASQKGHTDTVKLLLEKSPNVDLCDKDGCSPLCMASQKGHTDTVRLLLVKSPNIDLCDYGDRSPLLLASQNGHTNIVMLLLEKNPNVHLCNNDGCSPLLLASQNGHLEIVKLLIEKNHNVDLCNNNGCSPLLVASQVEHTDVVKLLLEKNAKVDLCDKNSCSPLLLACQNGHRDIVNLLLEKNPNVDLCNNDGCSPLLLASQNGHTDVVELLLEKNPKVDLCCYKGFTPLITACANNNTSIIKLLMQHKPDTNAQTYDGGSALVFSAWNENIEIIQLLLKNNADCNICAHSKTFITDTTKDCPTLEEVKQNCFNILTKNAPSFVTDYVRKKSVDYAFDVVAGCSPLHYACFRGNIDVVRCLLDHKANINIKKENGTTPLFYACEVGHEDLVDFLLDKEANTQMYRRDGKSPLSIAKDNGHQHIVLIVTECMKKENKTSS